MWNICAVKHDVIFLGIEVLNSQGKFHSVISLWFIINPSNSLNVVCEFLHYLDCSLNFYSFGQSLDLNKKLFLWKRWLHETFLSVCSEQISFWGGGGREQEKGVISMKQNAADGESVPIVWHFAVQKKSSSLSYFCRLEKLCESIDRKSVV